MQVEELQAKVSELLNAAGREVEQEFFNSEIRDGHSKYDSDEITEFRNELSDAGISFTHEENYGGEEMGSESWSVYTFTKGDVSVHVKFDGYYQRRQVLLDNIADAEGRLADAKSTLAAFDGLPENNTFNDYTDAIYAIEDKLASMARADCEGSYCCGVDQYQQEFIVNGKHYVGVLDVQYNRHDKTYYYVDETNFTVTALD